jgi:hypothetical protein
MFRSEAISDGKRPHPGCAARLHYQPAVTEDGAGAIAPAMKVHQDAGRVASRDNRPFPRYPARIDSSQGDVLGHWPNRAYLVEALTAFCPSGRPRLRGQQLTDRCNLGLVPVHFRQPRSDHLAQHFYELAFSVLASRDWSACDWLHAPESFAVAGLARLRGIAQVRLRSAEARVALLRLLVGH